jgi:transposase
MEAVDKLRLDFREGRLDVERLFDVVVTLQRQLESSQRQLESAKQRIEELEKKLGGPATAKVNEAFSVRAEEKRQEARLRRKKRKPAHKSRRGRVTTEEKLKLAQRAEDCFPEGVPEQDCHLSHARPVWRLENGRAVLIAYQIYRGPKNQYGKIPGVLGRSEIGLEIVVEVAYLVYVTGLSMDKVCQVLQFLQHLRLGKSQADALLRQLARHWQHEFDVLCTLLANSLVVHTDETGWSINSVWAFLSEKARVLFFGVPKDADTLEHILDPKTFAGLVISDDAAVYANFSQSQKCWAHLLRKAIKLTLEEPANQEYRQFTDRMLEIYRKACRIQRDGRLSESGLVRKAAQLEEELMELCAPVWDLELPSQEGAADDYRLLVNEVMRLALEEQLFTFVTTPAATQPNGASQPVAGTNNEAERTLRGPAAARATGRTSKSLVGARRQTILASVLESLRLYLPKYTLQGVLEEINRWERAGKSCFTRLLNKLKLPSPAETILDKVLPIPSG